MDHTGQRKWEKNAEASRVAHEDICKVCIKNGCQQDTYFRQVEQLVFHVNHNSTNHYVARTIKGVTQLKTKTDEGVTQQKTKTDEGVTKTCLY